jgi:L-amino acid N-acyltransferase YncA
MAIHEATEKRLLHIKGISHLTYEDEQLFRLAFPKDSVQYARSWLYCLRASHGDAGKLGYKFVNADLIAVIGFRKKVVYVTSIIDKTHGIMLQKLCQTIVEKTSKEVLLKKFNPRLHEQFSFQSTNRKLKKLFEDDSCPETILQLDRLFLSKNGELNPVAKKFIRKVNKIEKSDMQFDILEDISLLPEKQIEVFLAKDYEKYASYLPMVKYLYNHGEDLKYKVMLFIHKKQLCGLFIGESYSLTEMGLYCGITLKEIPGTTEWMDSQFFRKMFDEGIQTVYLGGSERGGISWYINKLLPYKPSYFVQTIVYDKSVKNNKNSISIRLINENDINPISEMYCDIYNSLEELGEHWTKHSAHNFIYSFYKRQPDLFFIAQYNKKLAGAIVAGIQPWWDGHHLVEGEIFVDPKLENKGIDKKLLRHLLVTARTKYHAVAWDTITPITGNHPLRSFQQLGFIEVPIWKAISGDIHTVLKRLKL